MADWKEIYHREFKNIEGVTWCVKIYDSNAPEGCESKEMSLSADAPILIEWSEIDKITPIQTSSMTLKVISESDREYLSLYSIEPGTIKVELFREGERYWSGMLDPELYEEPYAYKDHYEVQFTFSDFAILDRKRWEKTGPMTVREVVDGIIAATGLSIVNPNEKEFSTQAEGPSGQWYRNFAQQYVIAENFYDEEGEPMTLRKVLEETLRPYGILVVQKNGQVHIYDLCYLYGRDAESIYWKSSDQMLGVDRLYNRVTLSFSPYAENEIINGTIEHDDLKGLVSGHTIYKNYKATYYETDKIEGFKFYSSSITDSKLPISLNTSQNVSYFRIDAVHSGNNEAGVVWVWGVDPNHSDPPVYPKENIDEIQALSSTGMNCEEELMTVKKGFIVNSSTWTESGKQEIRLQIKLDVLVDVRYNPFEDAGDYNNKTDYDYMEGHCNIGYVPVMLYVKDSTGNILYHYENNDVRNSSDCSHENCKWVAGKGAWGCMWLCYYNSDDRIGKSCFGGWQTNKPIIGRFTGSIPKKWSAQGDGELIEIPPCGGYLELCIGRGIYQINCTKKGEFGEDTEFYRKVKWLLYKQPTVTIVDNNGKEPEYKDIVDSSWLATSAADELEIETLIGSATNKYKTPLTVRGCIVDENLNVITKFKRNDTVGRLEHLLIGSIYSQYGSRHETLGGTATLIHEFCPLSDASSPNKKYILLSEVQDIFENTSEIKMSELSAESYIPVII